MKRALLLLRKKRYAIPGVALLLLALLFILKQPTHDAKWSSDQRVLPKVSIVGDVVTIENIRDFTYSSETSYVPRYETKTYDLQKIQSVDYIVEPFGDFSGAAHTFLSFGFEGDEYISVSVEIRKKVGQTFSPWKAFLKNYEIMYVVATESDVIALRTEERKDEVYLYPTKIDKAHARKLFVSMMERVSDLYEKPEFYNLLTNTCTTNIVRHVNEISEIKVPLSYKVLLPGYSDKLAYDLGLLDVDVPYEKIREKYRVNDKVAAHLGERDFSRKIRE